MNRRLTKGEYTGAGAVRRMRKSRSGLILSVFLVFSLTLAIAPEDVLETTYDESETLPYEGMPPLAIARVQVAARTAQEVRSYSRLKPDGTSLFAAACVHDTAANRTSSVLSPLLCTLRC